MDQPVDHLLVMGVSGSGKTTAAAGLHAVLGWPIAEADDFHPAANVAKMAAGIPLTDEDRIPWLRTLRDWMSQQHALGVRTIVTCSALKRSYRDLLRQADGRVLPVHLVADAADLSRRMEHREGHFMPATLLPSQLSTLEALEPDEDGVTVRSRATPAETLDALLEAIREVGALGEPGA